MSFAPDFPSLDKRQLFARLGEGASANLTVVTPNRRLASTLAAEFDAIQQAHGLSSWESADVLPLTALVERLYEDALYSGASSSCKLPLVLGPAQEQLLWEEIIAASRWSGLLLTPSRTAAEASKAWALAQHWEIAGMLGHFPGNEDAEAFASWAEQYRRRTEGQAQIDTARLPDLVCGLFDSPALRRPSVLVLYAFDIITPQLRRFLAACVAAGTQVLSCRADRRNARILRWPQASARLELQRAASWARMWLESASGRPLRIGIVVPGLEQRRAEVARVLAGVLSPGFNLPGADRSLPSFTPSFNISLGVPLSNYPLVHAALGLLALAHGSVEHARVSRLLRSPFLRAARSEAMQRARLDADLRRRLPSRLTLPKLMAEVIAARAAVPALEASLNQVFQLAQGSARRALHEWADHFAALLKAAGFPGERTLDSVEYQTLAKWNQVLLELGTLSRVAPPMSAQEALSRLARLCADALFQPEDTGAPIQVLGVLESAGLAFDHLWICGLTDEAWPLPARPNALISPALQKKAGVPEASAETALELDRRITCDWLAAAAEVVISHALSEDDRELSPSPLIADIAESSLELPAYADYESVLHAARALEPLPDVLAPPLAVAQVRGGSRVLADQSACPFRAFAAHRLAAVPLEAPAEGLDAAARGNLLHALMKCIWDELKTQANLLATSTGELDAIIVRAAEAAVARIRRDAPISDELASLERRRLAKLARDWLDIERTRPAFEVVASEEKRPLAAAGLVFSGRIDRMDRLADGGHALIDYKSGTVTPRQWEGARPQDPQLPLYAVNATETVSAVVFAKLKTGGMRFMGYSRVDKAIPGVKQYHDWDGLLRDWKAELHRLGKAFATSEAAVDPKTLGQTCRYCELQPLCRVHERFSALALGEGGEGSAATDEGGEEE